MADEPETPAEKHYRLLIQLLSRIEDMGAVGICNPTDFYTKETASFWSQEKARARNSMTAEEKAKMEVRKKKKLISKLSPEERRLLGVA